MRFKLLKSLYEKREYIINALVILCTWAFMLTYFRPELLLSMTTTSGGDTASHYYPAYYLKNYLLPHKKIIGWSPGWYAGIPMFHYYFPMAYILMTFLSYIIPLQIAFKLVTVLGTFLLPPFVLISLRIMGFKFPIPVIGCMFTLPFLFMEANSMWGGNIPSTLAGEFSYSLSLAISIIFLGSMYKGIKEKKHWIRNGILFALVIFSHVITALWVFFSTAFLLLLTRGRKVQEYFRNFVYLFKVYFLAFLLVAFWLVPLVLNIGYTTKYADTWNVKFDQIFPKVIIGPNLAKNLQNPELNSPRVSGLSPLRFISALWVLNLVCITHLIRKKDERVAFLYFSVTVATILFLIGEYIGVINIRFVPFFQLTLLITAAIGLGMFLPKEFDWMITIALFILVLYWTSENTSFIDYWIEWNYSGFEKKSFWPVFSSVNEYLKGDESDPRVVYEHSAKHNQAGTVRAFESLPLFSGRSTLEGLYMQSTVTSPFVFYIQSEVSKEQSCPFFNHYPCTSFNLERGVEHLKMFNVKDYIVVSDTAKNAAKKHPELKLVKSIDPYEIYEIVTNDNRYVTVPEYEPVRMSMNGWRGTSYEWFKNGDLDVPIIFSDDEIEGIEKAASWNRLPKKPLMRNCSVHEHVSNEEVFFETNCIGLPHIIRISYHPNWRVEGAKKIYIVSPSFMLVFPEKSKVRLWFGSTIINYVSDALTLVGVFTVLYFTFLKSQIVMRLLRR